MWDNHRILGAIANALFGIAAALVFCAAVWALAHSSAFPLRAVRVEGEFVHVTRESIAQSLRGRTGGGFFTVDLGAVRAGLKTNPWVRLAEVRRAWPDSLEVYLEERVAMARWGSPGDGRLVDTFGEIFRGDSDAALPSLAGPPGTERELTRRYVQFRELLTPLDVEPRAVTLSPRYAWQLRLSNGLAVQLGRESERQPVRERLGRFVAFYPQTLDRLGRSFEYVDLRYPNGFALRVRDSQHAGAPKTPRARAGN